jgi:hypothetical protein
MNEDGVGLAIRDTLFSFFIFFLFSFICTPELEPLFHYILSLPKVVESVAQ